MSGAGTARRHGRAVLTLSASEVAGKIATLLTFMLIARMSSVADYGLFAYGLSLGLLLAVLSSLGLDARLIQMAGRTRADSDAWLTALVAFRLMIGATMVVGLWIVLAVIDVDPARRLVLVSLLLAALIDTLNDAFRAAASVFDRQQGPAIVLVVQRFATLAFVAFGAATVADAAVAYLVGTVIGAAAMAVVAQRAGARLRPSAVRSSHVRDLVVAIPVYGGNALVSMALFRIDIVILAALAGDVAVGHYSAAYRLIETALFISWSLSRVITPILAREGSSSGVATKTLGITYVVLTAVYLPYGVALAVDGDQIVTLLFGSGFETSAVFVWLALAPWLFAMGHLAATALLAWRPDRTVLLASILALGANIGLNFVLIPPFGAVGAAAATSLAFVVQIAVTFRSIRKHVVASRVLSGMAIAVTSTLLMLGVMLTLSSLWLSLLAGAVVYLAVWWAGTSKFDPTTADLIRTVVRRRVRSS